MRTHDFDPSALRNFKKEVLEFISFTIEVIMASADIANYKVDLAPLLAHFRPSFYRTDTPRVNKRSKYEENLTFTDQFDNFIVFCRADCCFDLLKNPEREYAECNVDKGYLSYSVYHHSNSYYVVSETRVNTNGWCGHFTSFVVVPSLEPLIEFLIAAREY